MEKALRSSVGGIMTTTVRCTEGRCNMVVKKALRRSAGGKPKTLAPVRTQTGPDPRSGAENGGLESGPGAAQMPHRLRFCRGGGGEETLIAGIQALLSDFKPQQHESPAHARATR